MGVLRALLWQLVCPVLPEQYSMTIQTRFSVTTTSYKRAMCGCTNCRWWCISRARLESSFFADLSTTCIWANGPSARQSFFSLDVV